MAVEHFQVQVDGQWLAVSVENREDKLVVRSGARVWSADLKHIGETSLISLLLDNQSVDLLVYRDRDSSTILWDTDRYEVRVKPAWSLQAGRAGAEHGEAAEVTIESPLTGVLAEVRAEVGQKVERGDVLFIVEAMKMQNELRSPRTGTVKAVRVRPGQKVASKQALAVVA